MEIMIDSANVKLIKNLNKTLNIAGVTTNPSILKKDGEQDVLSQLTEIKDFIHPGSLHVQVVGKSIEQIIDDAYAICEKLSKDVYIKIPTNEVGLKAMKQLKSEGFNITATAIYSEIQGYYALNIGADYLAPYFNRMENNGVNSETVINHLSAKIHQERLESKILAASFKNIDQVNRAIQAGSQAITVSPELLLTGMTSVLVEQAVDDFQKDWYNKYKTENLRSYL